MSNTAKETYHVLVADDSEPDRILLKEAMRNAARLHIIAEVTNGNDVIAYFNGHKQFRDRSQFPVPDLLLLDLKMPGRDGFEVLEWLSQKPFSHVTVVVLTDSMHPEHIKRALDLGADLFQVKPRASHDRNAMILALEERLVSSRAKAAQSMKSRLSRSFA